MSESTTSHPRRCLLERDGSVLWVRLNRPEARNGINMEMCAELQATFDRIDDDSEIRAAIVTGQDRPSAPAAT